MSEANAEKFLDKAKNDSALQDELQNQRSKFMATAKQHGYEFTQEELHNVLKKRWAVKKPHDDPDTTCAG